jgi:hypothetical protein
VNQPLRRLASLVLLAGVLPAFSSCAELQQLLGSGLGGVLSPPKVTFLGADLVRSPSQLNISAFYCPKLLTEKAGLGFAADLLCSKFFGKAPSQDDMMVGFDLRFEVANPNQIPLPLSEILSAITVFPGQTQQNLGAVCLSLCAPGDANCLGGASTTGCAKAPGDVKSLADFPAAAARYLLGQGVSEAGGKPLGFSLPKVTAASKLAVVARLGLTPEAFLPAMQELAQRSLSELKTGKSPAFEIPYKLEGTVFANAGSLGRVAAGFGPSSGTWPVPTQKLIP